MECPGGAMMICLHLSRPRRPCVAFSQPRPDPWNLKPGSPLNIFW